MKHGRDKADIEIKPALYHTNAPIVRGSRQPAEVTKKKKKDTRDYLRGDEVTTGFPG